jgi:hypothetical protein
MSEFTSPEVSKRLADAGFKAEADAYYQEWPDKGLGWSMGTYDIYATVHVPAYRADTLEDWLMTQGFFSRRTATLQIAYRAVKVGEPLDPVSSVSVRQDEKWIGHYIVTAFNGGGEPIGQREMPRRVDALGEVVLEIMGVKP